MTGDAFNPDCPTRQLLDRIGDKWAVLAMLTLADGPVRFNDLRRRIAGISQKMLSQTLKSLERDGLISGRWQTTEHNRRAKYYSLTRTGQKVLDRERTQWERLSAAISLVVRAV